MKKMLLTLASFFCVVGYTSLLFAQDFSAGGPLGATNQAGTFVPMSDNVKVYGSFHFTESCTFDPERNLILSMNRGNDAGSDDGYVSLINPDGSVHTSKWIGATRDGLELRDPIGSAISNGILYTADNGSRHLRSFDLETGEPMNSISIPGSGFINGVAATAGGDVSVFTQGAPLNSPNGVAMDNDGNIVVVNIGDAAVITYDPSGEVVKQESAIEGGNDGVVVLENGTKYVSSVRFGSVSRIDSSGNAQLIARGIPSAASMCYDSRQNQLVIPMNPHYAMAFIPL